MDIAFDTANDQNVTDGNATNSFNLTVAAGATLLLVFSGDNANGTVTGTWNTTEALTEITHYAFGSRTLWVFGLLNPTPGTHALAMARTIATSNFRVLATTYLGTDSSLMPANFNHTEGTSDSPSASLATAGTGSWLWGGVNANAGTIAAGSGTTLRTSNLAASGFAIGDSNATVTPGSNSLNFTQASSDTFSIPLVEIKVPAVASAPATHFLSLLGAGS